MAVRFVARSGATVRLAANTMDVLLSAGDVESGVDRGDGTVGTFTVPSVGDVRDGTGYGEDGTEFEGTLVVPDYSSVTASA
ncbi:MAG: hypothetical protein ACYTFQ_29160, partial [Planctomycetota bacterium]